MESERIKIGKVVLFGILLLALVFVSVGCANGAITPRAWERTFGGDGYDLAYSVLETSDGGYLFAGKTSSYGAGYDDAWLVKTDSNGTEQWNKTYGDAIYQNALSVLQTSDGGYVFAGYLADDAWLVKTDSYGTEQWNKTYGGIYGDSAKSLIKTSDSGYIFAGYTNSYGFGKPDFWVVRTDSNGTELWNKTYGGTSFDYANAVQKTSDGGYIIAGSTRSYGAGSYDAWLIKEKTELPVCNINTGKNYSKIQDAIDDSETKERHIIAVDAGTYFEHVVVYKSITLRGVNIPVLNAGGIGSAITVTANGCIIEGFNVTGSGSNYADAGIKVNSNNNEIKNNIAYLNNNYGIYLSGSSDSLLANNTALKNYYGIRLDNSFNNILTNNAANFNDYGIDLAFSSNNTLFITLPIQTTYVELESGE